MTCAAGRVAKEMPFSMPPAPSELPKSRILLPLTGSDSNPLAEAKAIAEEDPLVRGAYQTYELGAWLMSNRQNNYRPNVRQMANQ